MERRQLLAITGGAAGGVLMGGLGSSAPAAAASPWDQVPVILGRIVPPTFPDRSFDIRDYGAVGDNTKDCTPAFRQAIAACNAAGGGRVLVPSGTYRTGKIHLLSNVNLRVEGTIRFRTDTASFMPTVYTRWQGIECFNWSPFIYAYEKTNVAITGPGTIDGNAQNGPWFGFDSQRGPDWDRLQQQAVDGVPVSSRQYGDGHYLKPNMIQLYKCRNILIEGVRIRNPAMWAIHPVLSTNVTVRGVSVYSRGAMVDGCDPESCADVHIHGCTFDTGDDGTVIKSGRDTDGRRVGVPSSDIVIENNDYYGRWGAITVGSEMSGGVRNVFAQDCRLHRGSSYAPFHALYLKTNKRRGGEVSNIHVRRIRGGPVDRGVIHVDMNYSLTGPGFGPIVYPVFRDISVDELVVNDSPYAVRISGIPESHLRNFLIANSAFTAIDNPTPQITNADNVRFVNTTINGKPIGDPAPPGTRYEAETASIYHGVVESNHAGYTGAGFVNYANEVGSHVEFSVSVAAAGSRSLALRYANGTTVNRPMDISVNGTVVAAGVAFPATGAWTTWKTVTVPATLPAGASLIRATATTANGGPNLDHLEIPA